MSDEAALIAAGIIASLWAAVLFLWAKPATGHGRLARALLAANAAGWLLVVLVAAAGGDGHPPPFVVVALLFWLLNLLLMPVGATILWVSRRDAVERKSYLAVAAAYVAANVLALYVIPVTWSYLH